MSLFLATTVALLLVVCATADSDPACLELLAPDLEGVDCDASTEAERIRWGVNMTAQADLPNGNKKIWYTTIEAPNEPFACLLDSGILPTCETSFAGVTGQRIIPQKNYKEKLDNSGYKKNGAIVPGIRIHTPGNTNVPRSDFPKWTRWYQEYHNVQIFRIHAGEYKVDDDSRGRSAARIEAESAQAWSALATNKWKRFEGTYTFIKANDATIFQVFSSQIAWSVILEVDQAGVLRYRERRGRTVYPLGPETSALLRPVRVTVCDNGVAAEVFVDGVSQSDGPYDGVSDDWPRPPGAKTHFRWGTYVTTNNQIGEKNSAVDSLLFVAGSRIDEVEGETCGPT